MFIEQDNVSAISKLSKFSPPWLNWAFGTLNFSHCLHLFASMDRANLPSLPFKPHRHFTGPPKMVLSLQTSWRDFVRWADGDACSSIQWGKQWVQLPPEVCCEREDVRPGLGVVERHLALFIVQVDGQAVRRHGRGQRHRRGSHAGEELVPAAPQYPVALLRRHRELATAFGVGGRHAYAPLPGVGDVHLPVVASTAVALPAGDGGSNVEALRAVGEVFGLRAGLLHLPLVLWDVQPRVVGHGVQRHVRYRTTRERRWVGTRGVGGGGGRQPITYDIFMLSKAILTTFSLKYFICVCVLGGGQKQDFGPYWSRRPCGWNQWKRDALCS